MLGLLRRLLRGNADLGTTRSPLPEVIAPEAPEVSQEPASAEIKSIASIVEHRSFQLSGGKDCQAGIAACKYRTPLATSPGPRGGYVFSTAEGLAVGRISGRHPVAQELARGAVVLWASINTVRSAPGADGLLSSPTVQVVTGPAGATWAPPAEEPVKAYPTAIVGESNYQAALRKCRPGDPVRLVHEPDNPFDRKALAVVTMKGETIGYIPRDSWLHRGLLVEEKGYTAAIASMGKSGGFIGAVLEVRLEGQPVEVRPFRKA